MKKVLAVLIFLTVLIFSSYSERNLLMQSIQLSTYEELQAMCNAYGLDSKSDENGLRRNLFSYFGIEETESSEEEEELSESAASIIIESSQTLYSSEKVIILSGNVKMSFSAADDGTERSVSADKVFIDIEKKILEASGRVSLSEKAETVRAYEGQILRLDWGNLDIVVFSGGNTTTRTNSDGESIIFYADGKSISYSGSLDGVFFRDGMISTSQDEPYWSITASGLSILENDFFLDNAVLRLGRVPIFYIPFFFYPGTRLSFNPAIGFSGTKGAFLSATLELYGSYPKLKLQGSSDNRKDVASSIISFLKTDEDGKTVRDGFYYRALKEGEEPGALEQWARKSSSYLATFADVYEKLGLVLGLDTLNRFYDGKLSVGAVGAAGYSAEKRDEYLGRFRYTFDFSLDYNADSLAFSAKLPFFSDPYVRADFLNRNTAFALTSLLGTEQTFPKLYSTQSSFTQLLNFSYSKTEGKFSFNISSLKADIDYSLGRVTENGEKRYKAKAVEASLPYFSFSSGGTFLDLKNLSWNRKNGKENEDENRTVKPKYQSSAAQAFSDELYSLQLAEKTGESLSESVGRENAVNAYEGPVLQQEKNLEEGGTFKIGYTYRQTLDNVYREELKHDSFYTKIGGTLYVKVSSPGQWFDITETVRPQFNYALNNISRQSAETDDFSLVSVLKVSSPKLGLTYDLTQKIYSHYRYSYSGTTTLKEAWGNWTKEDVSVHALNFSRKAGSFTFGFYTQLKPLTEVLKPSASYSKNGFTAHADFSLNRREGESNFKKDTGNLNFSFSSSFLQLSFSNRYDFTKSSYSLVQKAVVKPLNGLILTENASFKGNFKAERLSFAASYSLSANPFTINASTSMGFKGENFKKDNFTIALKLEQEELTLWKGRISLKSKLSSSFNYDFQNPYRSAFTASLGFDFRIAEFLDLSINVSSANKSFARYYREGSFSLESMFEDLLRSFDFFGEGRRNTGFNLSALSLSAVHYMKDWKLCIDAKGGLTTQYSGKYEWVPSVTVYIKWNAIPELKANGSWDGYNREWN